MKMNKIWKETQTASKDIHLELNYVHHQSSHPRNCLRRIMKKIRDDVNESKKQKEKEMLIKIRIKENKGMRFQNMNEKTMNR